MRNTFSMSYIDAICVIAHNHRMNINQIASLTGSSPEWVTDVRNRMGNNVGVSAVSNYDEAFLAVSRFVEYNDNLRFSESVLSQRKHELSLCRRDTLRFIYRYNDFKAANRLHDEALEKYKRAKRMLRFAFKKVKKLYAVIPEQEGFKGYKDTFERIVSSVYGLRSVESFTANTEVNPLNKYEIICNAPTNGGLRLMESICLTNNKFNDLKNLLHG